MTPSLQFAEQVEKEAEKYANSTFIFYKEEPKLKNAFIAGANSKAVTERIAELEKQIQEKKKYSEEDMIKLIEFMQMTASTLQPKDLFKAYINPIS